MKHHSLLSALIGLGIAGFAIGVATFAMAVSSDHIDAPVARAIFGLAIGWSFIGTGLFAWYRRPANRIGLLMTALGFAWFVSEFETSDVPALYIMGEALGSLAITILVHLVLSFPSGRLEGQLSHWLVRVGYFIALVYLPAVFLVVDTKSKDECGPECPANPIAIDQNQELANLLFGIVSVIGVIALALTLWIAIGRWRNAPLEYRRSLGPILWAGLVTLVLFLMVLATGLVGSDVEDTIYVIALAPLVCVPYGFLAGLLRTKLSEAEQIAEENERLDAELQARLHELRASRARIVEAGYTARRQLERDLHDGAQQRLVGLALSLRLARERMQSDPDGATELLDEASAELATATQELRELARGIHPAILSERGLGDAVRSLVKATPFPVELQNDVPGRLPAPVEATSYFVVSEALANATKHSRATRGQVELTATNGNLHVEVRDDGVGGADASGSGLRGLSDRVVAMGGGLEIISPEGGGTIVRALIPVHMDN